MRRALAAFLLSLGVTGALAFNSEDTPVMFQDGESAPELGRPRDWVNTDFSKQESALGYGPSAFAIPAGMEPRVSFWIDIYTKYTTDQGLLHDSRYVHIIYEALDFTDINGDDRISPSAKRRARLKRVKDAKARIKERLTRLAKVKGPEGLEGEDLRYWHLFTSIDDEDRFAEATHRKRLRFQLGQRDRFEMGLFYSGRYLEQMEKIFRESGLPVELTRLPFVESSFNLKARSRVGASGIWQFMRGTARRFLRMDGSVDERNDPIHATQAAARFMKFNYELLGSWPLAITAYNHGPGGVMGLVKKAGTDNIAELVDERRGRFGFASANFYACFLAALEVERNSEKYFGKVQRDSALAGPEIKLEKPVTSSDLIRWFGGNTEIAKLYNPHVRDHIWSRGRQIQKGNFIRVPQERYEGILAELGRYKAPPTREAAAEGQTYSIGQGDTLSEIAIQFGVSTRDLMSVNNIADPRDLRPGQTIVIPGK